jgi:hypothetical protein
MHSPQGEVNGAETHRLLFREVSIAETAQWCFIYLLYY